SALRVEQVYIIVRIGFQFHKGLQREQFSFPFKAVEQFVKIIEIGTALGYAGHALVCPGRQLVNEMADHDCVGDFVRQDGVEEIGIIGMDRDIAMVVPTFLKSAGVATGVLGGLFEFLAAVVQIQVTLRTPIFFRFAKPAFIG